MDGVILVILINFIYNELGKLVMVDVDIIEVVKVVVVVGVDFIVIILYGYIEEIKIEFFFGFELLK